jgi:hypothetical protein
MFSTLQKATFPAYFTLQSIAPVLMMLTYPSHTSSTWGWRPLLNGPGSDRLALVLISTMLVTAVVNLVYVGPQTTEVMRLRKHQETRDGKKSYDAGPHSDEMQKLNKQFGMLHGISSMTNMIGFLGMCWYGVLVAEKLQV